ncbi:MAG: FtsB family cell division protein [Bacteroidales bacterium]
MWARIPSFLRNKYLIALLAVLVWLLFFDSHNLIQQWRMQRQLKELRQEREFYLEEIRRDSTVIEELKTDPDALERYAREVFLMKKKGEDVFIIVDE